MSIQYSDKNADATCNNPEPYNIGSSSNQFQIVVDGGATQTVTLTNGSARTAAQVVSDLSGLSGVTASVASVDSINYVRLRTSSANGPNSTILFNAPSNNSNTILGFTATTYTGGNNVAYQFLADTAQHIINGIEQGLNNAGWITISGHQSTPCVVQSSMTPANANLRMQIKLAVSSTNCGLNIQNVANSVAGTNAGPILVSMAGASYTVLANKYQAFVFIPGAFSTFNTFACWGVPWIPTFLQGVLWEAMWLNENSGGQGSTSFRTTLTNQSTNGNFNTWQQTINNGILSINGATGGNGTLGFFITTNSSKFGTNGNSQNGTRYHDLSAVMCDPLIAWGTTGSSDELTVKGQLWDAFLSTDSYPGDTIITSLDSHNWHGITHNNSGNWPNQSAGTDRGTLFVVTP